MKLRLPNSFLERKDFNSRSTVMVRMPDPFPI